MSALSSILLYYINPGTCDTYISGHYIIIITTNITTTTIIIIITTTIIITTIITTIAMHSPVAPGSLMGTWLGVYHDEMHRCKYHTLAARQI